MGAQRDRHRHLFAARGPNPAEELAVAVLTEVENHRTVKAEQNAVEFPVFGDSENRSSEPLEGGALDLEKSVGLPSEQVSGFSDGHTWRPLPC